MPAQNVEVPLRARTQGAQRRRAIANPPGWGGDWLRLARGLKSYGLHSHKAPPFRGRLATPRVVNGAAPFDVTSVWPIQPRPTHSAAKLAP